MPPELETSQEQVLFEVTTETTAVELSVVPPGLFSAHVQGLKPEAWLPNKVKATYSVCWRGNSWHFEQKYLLSDVDHAPLVQFLKNFASQYILIRVSYDRSKFQKQMKTVIADLQQQQEIVVCELARGQDRNDLVILLTKRQRQAVEERMLRLQRFNQETLIYPLDDFLLKSKLKPHEFAPFIRGLIGYYSEAIKSYLIKNLARFGLRNDLLINCIRPLSPGESEAASKFRTRTGVVFEITGYEECFGKFYQFVEKWFDKLNWMILEVDQIECSKRERIGEWMLKNKGVKAVLVSEGRRAGEGEQRVAVFAPRSDKANLEKDLRTATRIITGKQFQNMNFNLIFKYKTEFKKFMAAEKGNQSNLRVQDQYILVDCDLRAEQTVRRLIGQFLLLYAEEEVEIHEFRTPFHVALFRLFYAALIKTKPINVYVQNEKLYRLNCKKMAEQAQTEISDLFKAMRKELVFKPLARALPQKREYFEVTEAPQEWWNPECLESRRYKLTDKIGISLRSYGSIANSDSDCIFIVEDFSKCGQLKELLREEEVSDRFEQIVKKNKIVTRPLRFSKYFQNITIWMIPQEYSQKRPQTFTGVRLKNDMQSLLSSSGNLMQVKFMLPTQSEHLVEVFLPVLLETLVTTTNLHGSHSRQVTFFTSCEKGAAVRRELVGNLGKFNRMGRVQRITDLDLREEDLEKIVEYKYRELKYFETKATRSATPVNSFIFSREFLKKGKIPIFLSPSSPLPLLPTLRRVHGFLLEQVFLIGKDLIKKLKAKLSELGQLRVLASLVRRYFRTLECLVVYSCLEKGVFCHRLVFTEQSERMYKVFGELEVQLKGQKILCRNNQVRTQYQMVNNQFLELYRVETHPEKVRELHSLKRCVGL